MRTNSSRKEPIDLYAVMQNVPKLLGMELTWRKNAWEGRYYINGERHPYQRDKLKVKFWAKPSGGNVIMVYEQGGESLSLQNWLQRYGGAADWREAQDMMRGNSTPRIELMRFTRSGEEKTNYIPREDFEQYRQYNLWDCPLFCFMSRLFGEQKARETWARYNVVTDDRGLAVFFYANADGQLCYDKRIRYKISGKRDKTFGGTRKYKTDNGYRERPLFGAHLITGEAGEVINVVESEKTALLASMYYGGLWCATGGKNNLRDTNDNMRLYPDIDAIEEWRQKGHVVEWWADITVGEHDDIGDLVISRLRENPIVNA